jgi:hypothetical protein
MTTIVTRTGVGGKGTPLTHVEVDTNFTRLNTFKVEQTSSVASAQLPAGTTLQRDAVPVTGSLRFNTSTSRAELRTDSAWANVVTSVSPVDDIASSSLATGTASSTTYLRGDRTWATIVSGASISNDTTTNASYFPIWATSNTGTPTTVYVSDTKLYFNPATGTLNVTNLNSLSDVTLKQNVTPIQNATQTIQGLNGVEFEWKENGKKSAGVIAQQLENILPHLVETSADGIKSVNYSGLIAYLIETVKQQDSRITELERIINK